MNKRYVGVDLSLTGTGIVVLDDKEKCIIQSLFGPKNCSKLMRLKKFYEFFHSFLSPTSEIDCIAVEGYSYGSKGSRVFDLGELGGVFKLCIAEMSLEGKIYVVAPPTLKKFITGKGKGDKSVIMKYVFKNWGFDTDDNNIADAYGLAKVAYCIANPDSFDLTKARKESLSTILRSKEDA